MLKVRHWGILLTAFSFVLASCSLEQRGGAAEEDDDDDSEGDGNIKKATAVINPTKGNTVHGKVQFIAVDGGVQIIADIEGLTPGKHGFHIHEHGDCSAPDGSSAGGHYNPTNKKHGSPDSEERHVGDFGNLEANDKGVAHYDRIDKVIQLNGPQSIVDKSIIIHADPDDLVTQPTGNSGARVACGIIESEE